MQNLIIDDLEDLLTLNFEFNVNCVELQETTNVSSLTISPDLTAFDFNSDNKYHTVLIDDNDALLTDVKHYSTVFFKLFSVKDKLNIQLCQYYSGCLPPSYRLAIKKLNFFNALQFLKNSLPLQLIAIGGREELASLENKYKLSLYDRGFVLKSKVLEWFASELSI